MSRTSAAALLMVLMLPSATSAERDYGILGQEAAGWGVESWANLPKDQTALDIGDFSGKVLYLYCFQSWCPGCHKHGFPTLQKLVKKYHGDPAVGFVAVQTVFEGFTHNTVEKGRKTVKEYGLTIPVGHSGSAEKYSTLMARYRTGETPWTIIIDSRGDVRFNGFFVTVEGASAIIDSLKQERAKD